MGRIKAITFDYWGTLYHGATARAQRMSRLIEVLRAHNYGKPCPCRPPGSERLRKAAACQIAGCEAVFYVFLWQA